MHVLAKDPVCVDASIAAAMLLPEPTTDLALETWAAWLADERLLLVPPHFAPEVVSAVRRAVVRGRISLEDEDRALSSFLAERLSEVHVVAVESFVWERAVGLARELGRGGVYDTLYLAVAEDAGAEFWTADGNLARALEAGGDLLPDWVHLIEP